MIKRVFFVLVILHAVMHLVALKSLGYPVGPVPAYIAFCWVGAAALLLVFAVMYLRDQEYAWLAGAMASALSALAIFLAWKTAAFGMVPTIAIFLVSLGLEDSWEHRKGFCKEIELVLQHSRYLDERIVTEQDLSTVPEPVQKWLRRSGVVGRPFMSVGRLAQEVEMNMKPEKEKWISATAVQYTSVVSPSLIWVVRAKINDVLDLLGRDKFQDGKGQTLMKFHSTFIDESAKSRKVHEAAMQRYLAEMVWFPSLALSPSVTWKQIDENAVKASMEYEGRWCTGVFHFSTHGDILGFSTRRFLGTDSDAKKHDWSLDVLQCKPFNGILVPSKVASTWQLEDRDWTQQRVRVTSVCYNDDAIAKFADDEASLRKGAPGFSATAR